MEERALGAHGPVVPVLGLGTWRTLDVPASAQPSADAVVAAALESGTRLFDTSPMYGRAEDVLAAALGEGRSEVLIATKIWTPDPATGRAQLERQLGLFGKRIDVQQIHNLVAWRDHLPMLEDARRDGLVGVIGATHYDPSAFDELEDIMRTDRVHVVQVPYNPLEREAGRRLLPLAAELGLGVIVMRPFGEGALFPGPRPSALAGLSVESWAEALLRWSLSDERVHAAIPATSRPEHVEVNAAAAEKPRLPEDERRHIQQLAERYAS
jgi:diketogulonate reductase-like aldo/keto reductase